MVVRMKACHPMAIVLLLQVPQRTTRLSLSAQGSIAGSESGDREQVGCGA